MSEDNDILSIQGNTRDRATDERNEHKTKTPSFFINVGLAITGLALTIGLVTAELSPYQILLLSIAMIVVGGKLKDSDIKKEFLSHWPQTFRVVGWAMLLTFLLLMSPFGGWLSSVTDKTFDFFSCQVDDSSKFCKSEEDTGGTAHTETAEAGVRYPIVEECEGRFAYTQDCERVTLIDGVTYQRFRKHDKCLVNNAKDVIDYVLLGGREVRYSSKIDGEVSVNIYDLSAGQSFDGYTCD